MLQKEVSKAYSLLIQGEVPPVPLTQGERNRNRIKEVDLFRFELLLDKQGKTGQQRGPEVGWPGQAEGGAGEGREEPGQQEEELVQWSEGNSGWEVGGVALKGFEQQNVLVRSALQEDHAAKWVKGWQRILLKERDHRESVTKVQNRGVENPKLWC